MKDKALEMAYYLKEKSKIGWADDYGHRLAQASEIISNLVTELHYLEFHVQGLTEENKKLVSELNKTKPLTDDEIMKEWDKAHKMGAIR